jgi:hypothetical protein
VARKKYYKKRLREDKHGWSFQKLTLARLPESIKTSLACIQVVAEDKKSKSSTCRFNGDLASKVSVEKVLFEL